MKALEVKGLCKKYGDFALDNVNFSLEQGTITGLVGRNGAGKTTILRSILGAAHIDTGEISFLGRPIDAQTKQDIGVVYDACCFSEMLKIRQIDSVLGDIYHNWSQDVFLGLCEHYELPEHKTIKTFSRILILSHGKMRIDVEKDTLLNEYIVLKGSPEQLGQMQPEDILGVKKQAYSFEALCVGRERMQEKYPQFVCDSADIEQILILLEGGADQ